MAEKRYYWLQLREGFFKQKEIKKLRKIAGGDTYTIIYLKMLLTAVKQGNKLYFEGVESTFSDELALELDEDPENVRVTLAFLERQGLIKVISEDEFYLLQCNEMVGSESESAARVRRYREKKALQCNTDVTSMLREGNIDIDKDIEIDKEKKYKYFCSELKNSEPQPKVEIEPAAVSGTKVEIEPSQTPGTRVETEPGQEVFIKLPLIDRTDFAVSEAYVRELQELYPAVDVKQALRNMRGWLDSNPKNRKTPRGIKRFITGWIGREQDRAPRKTGETQNGVRNRFNNFQQREYDFDKLEKELLQK